MKMTDKEMDGFQDAANAAYGVQVILGLLECYPNKLEDNEIIAISATLKAAIGPAVSFMMAELKTHGMG
ncbi:UNVERIFIED_ORG: hypothetical protein FHW05_002341 [Pantoea agglomerans]